MSIKYLCGIDVDNGLLYTDTANDRVGIGTTSPSELLTLEGADTPSIKIIDTTTPVTLNISAANSRASVGTETSHPLRFLTNDTERMRINSSGDVGIGTTAPGVELDVVGTIRTTNAGGNQANFTGNSLLFPDAATATIGANIVNFNPGTKNLAIGSSSTKWNTVSMTCNTFQIITGLGVIPFKVTNSLVEIDKLLEIKEQVNIENLANATSDTDRFLVSDPGQSDRVKYRTGAQLAADIGAVTGGPFLPLAGGTMTGNTLHGDNVKSLYGTGNDLELYHDATNTYITNDTGDLYIRNNDNDKDIIFQSDNGAGGVSAYLTLDGSAARTIASKDIQFNDNVYARFGNATNGDLIIGHTNFGSPVNSISSPDGTTSLEIRASNLLLKSANSETYIDCNFNSSVDLYHNNVKKFQTLSTGASVTGRLGIETTTPNYELDVNGTANVTNLRVSGSQGSDGQVLTSTGSGVAWEDGGGGDFLPLNPTGSDVMTGDVRIAENKYFRFGASANAAGSLIIGHTNFGSPYSQILENGTGDLKISATNLILESANAETYIDCNFNSSVDLYHNNIKKFATLSTGASVTGSLGINTTSPNTQIEIVNSEDQTSTLRLTTSDNSAGNVSGEISFALDGSTIGAKIQSIINANEDGTDLKLDSTNTTLTGDLTVSGGDISLSGTGRIQGVDTVSASTDAANKAYVDAHTPTNTQTILFSNFQDSGSTTSSLRIPFNTLSETTSNQYYNHFDCPADGTIKRIRMHNTSGSLSTSFTTIFDIWVSATGSPTQSSGSLTASNGQIEYEPNLSFSKGDGIQIGYRKSAGAKYWQGVSASIILEFEQV